MAEAVAGGGGGCSSGSETGLSCSLDRLGLLSDSGLAGSFFPDAPAEPGGSKRVNLSVFSPTTVVMKCVNFFAKSKFRSRYILHALFWKFPATLLKPPYKDIRVEKTFWNNNYVGNSVK